MWIIIIVIAVGFLVKYFYDRDNVRQKSFNSGGVFTKYRHLINNLLALDPASKIFINSSSKVVLGMKAMTGEVLYTIKEGFNNKVIITYYFNLMNNKIEATWDFPNDMNQDDLTETILAKTEMAMENI